MAHANQGNHVLHALAATQVQKTPLLAKAGL